MMTPIEAPQEEYPSVPVMVQDMRTLLVVMTTQPHTQEEADTYNTTICTLVQKHRVIRQDGAPSPAIGLVGWSELTNG